MGIINISNQCSQHILNVWFFKDLCLIRKYIKYSLKLTFSWCENITIHPPYSKCWKYYFIHESMLMLKFYYQPFIEGEDVDENWWHEGLTFNYSHLYFFSGWFTSPADTLSNAVVSYDSSQHNITFWNFQKFISSIIPSWFSAQNFHIFS